MYIIKYISVIISKKGLVTIAAVWFESTILFKVAKIFNSKVKIGIDLAISLIFCADSISNFDHLILVVALIYKTFIFLLILL